MKNVIVPVKRDYSVNTYSWASEVNERAREWSERAKQAQEAKRSEAKQNAIVCD